jgi:hypothetical protein
MIQGLADCLRLDEDRDRTAEMSQYTQKAIQMPARMIPKVSTLSLPSITRGLGKNLRGGSPAPVTGHSFGEGHLIYIRGRIIA